MLKYFDQSQLLQFRFVSTKMADELVPRQFSTLSYDCPDDDDVEDYKFLEHIRNPRKVIIKNICGTEAHLKRITALGERLLGQVEYLYIEVDNDEETS